MECRDQCAPECYFSKVACQSDTWFGRKFALAIVKYHQPLHYTAIAGIESSNACYIDQWEARLSLFIWSHVWKLTLHGYLDMSIGFRCDNNIYRGHSTSYVSDTSWALIGWSLCKPLHAAKNSYIIHTHCHGFISIEIEMTTQSPNIEYIYHLTT